MQKVETTLTSQWTKSYRPVLSEQFDLIFSSILCLDSYSCSTRVLIDNSNDRKNISTCENFVRSVIVLRIRLWEEILFWNDVMYLTATLEEHVCTYSVFSTLEHFTSYNHWECNERLSNKIIELAVCLIIKQLIQYWRHIQYREHSL